MRKIKDSLAAKVFLWVACALTVCGLLVYGLVMVILPKQYTTLVNSRTAESIENLLTGLNGTDLETVKERVNNFCIENRASALLSVRGETLSLGDSSAADSSNEVYTLSASLQLSDLTEDAVLTIVTSTSTTAEITYTFLKILPAIVGLILLLSLLSAWFCSRVIVRPVLEISAVSKRMAQIDMTWHCDARRTDELGVLARSLNTLSERLAQAMDELETANRQLRKDVAVSRAMEKQRRDFFAAAGHELKTPVATLKGQLECMALGIGDYKNHDKYFPQALAAVDNMERLIKEILAISKMETGIPDAPFTRERLSTIMDACIEAATPLTEIKNIDVIIARDDGVYVNVSKSLFQKAVSNILANAVRYSPSGSEIRVSWTKDALTVENTGVTIDEAELPQLFTPFYRIDKSRSRSGGGSGLGLYIVKTILELHGFGYRIENHDGSVLFTVSLS